MSSRLQSLAKKARGAPEQAGVYLLKNTDLKIIYVGKAKNLRARLRTYFVEKIENLKIRALVREVFEFEVILTENEIEALLLERTLIKHQKPAYNVLLRDDKEYPYLRVDLNEQWPRIEKTRKRKDDGAIYLGPYGNVGHLRSLLAIIYKIFPLIRCSRYQFKHVKRPCNYYQMQMCLAPCHLPVPREDYVRMVERAVDILQGKTREVVRSLTLAMETAAAEEKFEEAARLRDQLAALRVSTQRQSVVLNTKIDADVFGIDIADGKALVYVLLIREGFMLGSDFYNLQSLLEDREQVLGEFLLQYYEHRVLPAKVLLPCALEEVIFAALPAQNCKVVVPKKKGDEQRLIALAQKNASFQLRYATRDFTAEMKAVQELLRLESLPRRIECVDISNFQNTAIVAAIVCFVDGKPQKNLYRKYKLARTAAKPDDYQSIAEVVERRLRRAERDGDICDLLLIDGGKGQLNAAVEATRKQGTAFSLPLAALAKDRKRHAVWGSISSGERIFVPHASDSILVPQEHHAFRLITHLRDEAHRFALSYHRQLRGKIFFGEV